MHTLNSHKKWDTDRDQGGPGDEIPLKQGNKYPVWVEFAGMDS